MRRITAPVTLVVFGAGASVDCLVGSKKTSKQLPPLTDDLARRCLEHPSSAGCSLLLQRIESQRQRDRSNFGFERALRTLFDQFAHTGQLGPQFIELRRVVRDVVRSSDALGSAEDTLYTKLFAELMFSPLITERGRTIAVLNLNYDTLACRAINDRQVYSSLDEFIEMTARPIALFHPHGSVLWAIHPPGTVNPDFMRQRASSEDQIHM